MIPEIVPVNIWTGNNSTVEFDFDFLINSESELTVIHKNKYGEQKTLQLNIDYKINQIGNENGGSITFPIQGSEFGLLQKDEVITLVLNIPIAQTSPYGTSAFLNLKSLEYSLDYITRLIQMLNRSIERCLKVDEGSNLNPNQVIDDLKDVERRAIVYVEQAQQEVEKAKEQVVFAAEQAQLAEQYAKQVEYGVRWQTFTEANWVAADDRYTMTLDEASLIILGIYRVIDGKKEKVVNIDISIENNKVTLTSPEAFAGGFLAASKTLGNYVHEQTLAANEWLITHNLGKYPVVTLVDYEGFVQIATVQYLSLNQIRVTFESEVSGFAYLS